LRKLKDFKCALWSEKYGSCPDLFAGNHLLTAHAKTCERMLRHMEQFMGTIVEWYEYSAFARYLMQLEGCASWGRVQRICVN